MKVGYTIIRTDGTEERGECERPQDYDVLAACIRKAVGAEEIERVRVPYNGEITDMFCDEMGHVRAEKKPANQKASDIYNRSNVGHQIPGDVIVFDRPVWDDVE